MKVLGIFDFVGYEPKISVYGSNRYKTSLGIIMGFICAMCIVGLSVYFTKIMFDRTEMSIITNIKKDTEKPVNLRNSIFFFNLVDGKLNPINKKYYEIKMDYWQFVREKPEDPLSTSTRNIPLEDCDKEKHFGNYPELSMQLLGSKCLAAGKYDLSLYGIYGDFMPNSFINIAINFCNNATMNDSCPSASEMAPVLRNVFIQYAYVDHEVDNNDVKNPTKPYLKFLSLAINWDLHTRYYDNIGIVNYFTDENLLFEDYQLISAYQATKIESAVSIRHGSSLYPGITFATLTLIRDPKVTTYKKSFLKVQTLLAKIGGILNALIFLFKFVSSVITKNLLLEKIINDYIHFEDLNETKPLVSNFQEMSVKSKHNLIVNKVDIHKIELTPDSQPNKNLKAYTNNIILYSQPGAKTNISNKRFQLNICSKIFPPKLCESVSKQSNKIQRMNECLNSWMSYQNIFKTLLQYERLKYVKLTSEEFRIFNSMKLYKFDNLNPTETKDGHKLQSEELEQMLKNQEENFLKRLNEY